MRFAIAALALCAATPAFATGGFLCAPTDGEGPTISLVIGHGIPGGVIGAAIEEQGSWRSTMDPDRTMVIDQWWIDEERTWIDIVHVETGAYEAKLRVRNEGFGGTGTLVYRGRSFEMRCRQD